MAAGSPASIRKAAARGFNLMLDQYASPEQIGERMALYRAEREAHGRPFDPMGVAVARQLYVAADRADAEAALARQAKYTQRTVSVSRAPARKGGSHVLAYAEESGGTEEHALYGTAEEICVKLAKLNDAGARYILLTMLGGKEQLRRFTHEVMPAFSATETRRLSGASTAVATRTDNAVAS
jgi:alkanesulfonate monooxygenase SsuD/methylene tetrahydromethanopterin reductase-like flavin-dependent oxidoreductase (luciferase family)